MTKKDRGSFAELSDAIMNLPLEPTSDSVAFTLSQKERKILIGGLSYLIASSDEESEDHQVLEALRERLIGRPN